MYSKKIFSLIIILLWGLAPFVSRGDESTEQNSDKFVARVAVVDIEAILQHSLAIQQIQKSISQMNQNIQNTLIEREIELKRLEELLISEKDKVSEQLFLQKQQDFNNKVSQLQSDVNKQKMLLDQTHSKAVQQVHDKVIDIIRLLSQKYRFNIVLPSSQILFVSKELNITADVIAELNAILPNVELTNLQNQK
jgi:Skp family chaperone for outer membrane proteins